MRVERAVSLGIERGKSFEVIVDGEPVLAFEGETAAAVLLASGRRVFRHTRQGDPRGPFCGMGVCYDCLVLISGNSVRACVTMVQPGVCIDTKGNPDKGSCND